MDKTLVSIIVPVHNSSKYLKKCLDSIVGQSYKNIEILAIENGSTDDSLKILNDYKDKIKLIVLKESGLSRARNEGLKRAKGEYIAFVDSDDTVEPDLIKKLVKSLETEKSDLAICNFREIYEKSNRIISRCAFPIETIKNKEIVENLVKFNCAIWNKLYKKSIIDENNIMFPENLKYEDMPFVLEYLSKSKVISKVNELLYNYLIHDKSEQTTVNNKVYDIFKILEICSKYYSKDQLESIYIRELTTYALKMKYVKDKNLRKNFIDEVYKNLGLTYPKWKTSKFIKDLKLIKRIIVKNKILLKIYTNISNMI